MIGPRAGLAYSLNPKTVIRTGYGIFYLPFIGVATGDAACTNGFLVNSNWLSSLDGLLNYLSNPFPSGLDLPTGNSLGLLSNVGQVLGGTRDGALDRTSRVGYAQQWNFNVQRELPMRFNVEAAYTGSKGTKLPDEGWQINQLTPDQLKLGAALQQLVPNPFAGVITSGTLAQPTVTRSQLLRPYPQFLGVSDFRPAAASSIYHAFQLRVQKEFSNDLSLLLAYTDGKLIDDSAGISGQAVGVTRHQDSFNRRADRSISSEDVSQRMVISYVYSLPIGRGKRFGAGWAKPARIALGDWQINGITTFATGTPLALTAANTSQSNSDVVRPNVVGDPTLPGGRSTSAKLAQWFNTAAFAQPVPFTFGNAGRTVPNVRGDSMKNFDFSVFKAFPIREKSRVEFRTEFFNLFNTPLFALPGQALGNAAFGVVSAQANSPRQVQLGLKAIF